MFTKNTNEVGKRRSSYSAAVPAEICRRYNISPRTHVEEEITKDRF